MSLIVKAPAGYGGTGGAVIINRIMEAAERQGQNRRLPKIGAYNVGGCSRKLWFIEQRIPPEDLPGRSLLVFDLGDRVEDAVAHWIAETDVTHIRTSRPEDTTTVPELGFRVRPDLFAELEIDGAVVPAVIEVKSMSDFGFSRAEAGIIDDGYLAQAECYCRAFGVAHVLFILYRKQTSHLHEVVYHRNDERWEAIKQSVGAARQPEMPPRPFAVEGDCKGCDGTGKTEKRQQPHKACAGSGKEIGGPFIPNFPCGYCGYKVHCWGELEQTFDRNDKPRWKPKTETA